MSNPQNKPKIYGFALPVWVNDPLADVHAYAIDQDGFHMEEHICSDLRWAEKDLQRPSKHEAYSARFPDGYEFVFIKTVSDRNDVGFRKALAESGNEHLFDRLMLLSNE